MYFLACFTGVAEWKHIQDIFYDDMESQTFGIFTKLTEEHVSKQSASKMKVKIAAQTLSNTVAIALELQSRYGGKFAHLHLIIFPRFLSFVV